MAGLTVLNREKGLSLREAFETIERLVGEESGRLHSAQHDVVGKQMDDFVFSVLIAELVRVVADQQERISELEKTLASEARGGKK
jgi:hypothetical protein